MGRGRGRPGRLSARVRPDGRHRLLLGDVAAFCPLLADFTHCGKWIYEDSLKDEYLADRLRWQFWTMRYE